MSQTGAREGMDNASYAQVVSTLNRIEQKLAVLVDPKGRLANIEQDLDTVRKLVDDHEKKIQRAHGAIGVLVLLGGAVEYIFHKVFK